MFCVETRSAWEGDENSLCESHAEPRTRMLITKSVMAPVFDDTLNALSPAAADSQYERE